MQVVRITGGLGNQMFQYAFGEYLKVVNHADVYLDISDYSYRRYHQGFELEKVFSGVEVRTLSDTDLNNVRVNRNAFFTKVMEKLFHVQLMRPTEFREYPATLAVKPSAAHSTVYYDGYWGMKEYIRTAEQEIRSAFTFRYVPEGKNRELLDAIEKAGNAVGVHVRRGDYLQQPNLAGVCDEAYYRRAMQIFLDRDPDTTFIFFSDDIPWVKEHLSPMAEHVICADWNTGADSCRDMQMMSLCHDNIMANSTFSWWAAWLNANPDKQVVIPADWSTARTTADLFEHRYVI